MLGSKRLSRKNTDSFGGDDVDPMNSLGNLADAMLVMSVGLMLALISAWQLDMSDLQAELADDAQDKTVDSQSLDDYGLSEYGKLYVDKDGKMYAVQEDDSGSSKSSKSGSSSGSK